MPIYYRLPSKSDRLLGKVAFAADGSFYFADSGNARIRRVDAQGKVWTVALVSPGPDDVALGPDERLYIADDEAGRILRLEPNGILTPLVSGLVRPWSVLVGPDQSVYIADAFAYRIRKFGVDGVLSTLAGTGQAGYSGDGAVASTARINAPFRMALGLDGSLYYGEAGGTRRISPEGILSTVASEGRVGVALNRMGHVYYTVGNLVKAVTPEGAILRIAGGGNPLDGLGDGGPANQARLIDPTDVSVAPDGSLFIIDRGTRRIRRVAPPLPGFTATDLLIPSEDGRELYHFDPSGRHLRTLDALTKAVRYSFSYDAEGRLIEVKDLDGDVTHIEWDGNGDPTAIESADGQRTSLTLDSNGYLAAVTNPAGERHTVEYTVEGLMTAFTDPKGNTNRFEYDDLGRLLKDTTAGGGGWTITHTENARGYTNAMTTAEGRTMSFKVEPLSTGDRKQVNAYPDGTVQTKLFKTNGEETTTAPDGTVTTLLQGPDPRFGMLAPVPQSVTTKLPSGLTAIIATARQVTLADTSNPLSLTGLSETATVNGKTFKQIYSAATRTWTATSAAGRPSTTVLNDKGRPILTQTPGFEAVQYAYDPRGRLNVVSQSTGAEARTTLIGYNAQGYVGSLTDALGRSLTRLFHLATLQT